MTNNNIIDWEKTFQIAGKKEYGEQMIVAFINEFPTDILVLKTMHQEKNYIAMQKWVHKIQGVLCYCILPRLKNTLNSLESALKNNIMADLSSLLDQLDTEVKLLIKTVPPQLRQKK